MKCRTINLLTGIALLVILVILALPGCANPGQPKLEQPFYLPVGSSVKIAGQKLSLRFDEVTSDSRCPINTVCISDGEAACALTIDDGTVNTVTLTVPGVTTWDYSEYMFKKYRLAFKLSPYPKSGERIAQSDYRLYMTVSIPK